MSKTHEQIPLLAKLGVYYQCDECASFVYRRSFYKGIDEVVAASTEDGKLLCSTCRNTELDSPIKIKA